MDIKNEINNNIKKSIDINVYDNYGIVDVPINNKYEKLEYKMRNKHKYPSTLKS